MPRLPYLDLLHVGEPLGPLLRSRPPLNLYRVLPHAPEAAMGFLSLGRALLTQTRLDPGLRELAILRVGALSNAGYEIHQHRKVARQVGLTDAEVNAVLSPPAVGDLAPRQRLVVDFTDALVRDVKVAPVLNEMVIGEFSGQIWLELQMIVGYYMLVSRVLENLEVDIEDDDIDKLELPNG